MKIYKDNEFITPMNYFAKNDKPSECPVCKTSPALSSIPLPFTYDELWVLNCRCSGRKVTGDSIPEVIANWNEKTR